MTRGERVICVSQSVRAHVLLHWPATPPERLRVIERGIDPAAFPRQPPPARADGRRLLLLPGRGTRLKGHAAAIELLARLRAAGVDAWLWLPGARAAGREGYLAELRGAGARARRRSSDCASGSDRGHGRRLSARPTSCCNCPPSRNPSAAPWSRRCAAAARWSAGTMAASANCSRRHYPEGQVRAAATREALLAATLRVLAQPRPPPPVNPQTLASDAGATLGGL